MLISLGMGWGTPIGAAAPAPAITRWALHKSTRPTGFDSTSNPGCRPGRQCMPSGLSAHRQLAERAQPGRECTGFAGITAFFGATEMAAADQAVGRISAEQITPYPCRGPAIGTPAAITPRGRMRRLRHHHVCIKPRGGSARRSPRGLVRLGPMAPKTLAFLVIRSPAFTPGSNYDLSSQT